MSDHRTPPHSLASEEALLGAVLLSHNALESVIDLITPSDFYSPSNALIYEAISHLYRHGDPVDVVTVSDYLSDRGNLDQIGGPATLIDLQAATPATSSAVRYAKSVSGYSVLRKVIGVALEASEAAYQPDVDPDAVVRKAQEGFAEALSGVMGGTPDDLWVLDDFLDRPMEQRPQWVIPGMLRQGWRAMVVATEGSGKTVLLRQIGIAAAQGIHPLHFQPMEPVRVLIVDLENPDDSVVDVCAPLRSQTELTSFDYDRERVYLWHKPGGINLRSRRDRVEFESVIATAKPDLVCLGPIYKSYNVASNESDELAAKEVMACFDDLRTRYSFALLLEHHAPKGSGSKRDLSPYGTSLWLRWPELGISLTVTDPTTGTMKLGRWRGDRMENAWPIEIRRGQPWLWQGVWPAGTFNNAPGGSALPSPDDFATDITDYGPPDDDWDYPDEDPLY